METVTLKVEGMTCAGCVRSVKRVLEDVPGVRSAEVSLERAEARVELDPVAGGGVDIAALKAAVEAAGYEAP
jgi:copper chaperone